MATARPDTYTVASGGNLYAGSAAPSPPPPPPPPPPSPSITLTAPAGLSTTVGSSLGFSAALANAGTLPLVGTPEIASGLTGTPSPGTVTWATGDLNKAFTYVWAAAGTASIRVRAADGTLSNALPVTIAPAPGPAPSEPPPPAPGTQIATLSLKSEGGALTAAPFSATVFPARGAVPSGSIVASSSDSTLRGAILSTWDDGSAAVVVVSGEATVTAGGTATIPVNVATGSSGTALTTAAISALVSSVAVNFQGSYGSASLTSFGSPERTWWATPGTICARYRLAAPTPGTTALEAVIDIHAWSDRALVEVVIENGKFDAAASTGSTTPPASATYTGATVSINGSTIATVSSSGSPQAVHDGFRAWYASGWVGAGNPSLRVTQLHTELQAHPLLFQCDQAATFSMATYASDAYAVWSNGRHRASMGSTGDDDTLGAIPAWEARALQSGDYRAWKATEAQALSILSYNINTRDSVGGTVAYSGIMPNKCQGSFWANWPSNSAGYAFEVAHQPAVGLMAFLSRPSPVFIEIAQKVGVWTGTIDSTRDLLNNFNEAAVGVTDTTGIVGNTQIRAKAWGIRNILHATWLSPSTHPWRAGGLEWLDRNVRYLKAYTSNSRFVLNAIWEGEPDAPTSLDSGLTGQNSSMWMLHYLIPEVHKLTDSKILTAISSARQTEAASVADALALQPVRWVNEQTNGGWRFLPYRTRQGDASSNMTAYTTWTAQRAADLSGAPTATTGLFGFGVGDETTWTAVEAQGTQTTAYQTTVYSAHFWAALVAAVERGVSGAVTAWNTVQSGITNLSTWRLGFGTNPKAGSTPRSGLAPAWIQAAGLNRYTRAPNSAGSGGSSIDAWGAIIVTETGDVYAPANGGHTDSRDNRVTKYDGSSNSPSGWSIVNATSLATPPIDVAYYYDDAGQTVNPKPGSRHNYNCLGYDQTTGRIYLIGYQGTWTSGFGFNTIDGYNIGTNAWDAPATYPYVGAVTSLSGSEFAVTVQYAPALRTFFWKGSNNRVYKWLAGAATKTDLGDYSTSPFNVMGRYPTAYDPTRDQLYCLQWGDGQGGGTGLTSKVVNNPNGTPSSATIALNSSAALTSLIASTPAYAAMDYDALRDRYVFHAGGTIYEVIPNGTTTWDVAFATTASGGDTPEAVPGGGLNKRWLYWQKGGVGGFFYLPRASGSLYFFRTS